MDSKVSEQFTPERGASAPEAPEGTGAPERVVRERVGEGRPPEPRVPLGSLVDDGAKQQPPLTALASFDVKAVEGILEEGLEPIYKGLSPEVQQQFRTVGEQTTRQVHSLLQEVKVQVGKIIQLIRGWLQIIPGVNRFFLEQETKIKMDKLMKLRQPPQ